MMMVYGLELAYSAPGHLANNALPRAARIESLGVSWEFSLPLEEQQLNVLGVWHS